MKCYESLSLKDKEVTQIYTLLLVHKLNNIYAGTDQLPTDFEEVMRLVTDHDTYLLLT